MALTRRGKSKVWWIDVRCNGRRIRRSTETDNKRLAEKIHAKVLTQIVEDKWFETLPGENKSFGEMMDRYMDGHSAINKAASTHQRSKSTVKQLKRFFGDFNIAAIHPRDISSYKEKRRKEGASPKSVNNELVLMGHAFNLAMKEWEWVNSNPVSMVSKERVDNLRERWLTRDEERRLLNASPRWLQEIIVFALNTGLRRGEVVKLRWPDINISRRTLTLREQKNKCVDTLPLNAATMEILQARSKIKSISSDFVFFSKAGTQMDGDNLYRSFGLARNKAGVTDLRFHDLRHTFATRLVQAGVDIYKVQRLMRHKSPQMTQRYAHHNPESLRDGVEVLDVLVTNWSQSA